ncbi:MAG: hypothetical protein WCC10_08835, partial [Tumebacillaceae bacterium]
MNKFLSYALAATVAMTTVVGVQAIAPQTAAAQDPYAVSFSGITASAGVNVRSGPGTNYAIVGSKPGNVSVQFAGIEYGTITPDAWLGKPDPRWFYYYENGVKRYIASAVIDGQPPASAIRAKDRAVMWAINAQGRT